MVSWVAGRGVAGTYMLLMCELLFLEYELSGHLHGETFGSVEIVDLPAR